MSYELFSEKHWCDSLGHSPRRDFTSKVFAPKAGVVRRLPDGRRVWAEHDPAKVPDEGCEVVPGMWDHEHCKMCWVKIRNGDSYWQNSQKHILCADCHAKFQERANKALEPTPTSVTPPAAQEPRQP